MVVPQQCDHLSPRLAVGYAIADTEPSVIALTEEELLLLQQQRGCSKCARYLKAVVAFYDRAYDAIPFRKAAGVPVKLAKRIIADTRAYAVRVHRNHFSSNPTTIAA